MKKKKIVVSFLAVILILFAAGFAYLKFSQYQPSVVANNTAKEAIDNKNYIAFETENKQKPVIIFYPGALVEPESYSIWAEQVARAGYSVYIMKMPLDLAVLSPNKADDILKMIGKNQKVILGGHSLGGVMVSRFAQKIPENQLLGIFFLASYPDEKGNLKNKSVPVLSLTGSEDKVLNQSAYQSAKKNLPKNTDYQMINGGNHAGFGSYGKQKGDGNATISNTNQQKIIANQIINWLKNK